MISVEAWTTIRYLKAQGLGTRSIAREVGVARNTVKHALRSEGPPKYQRQPRPNPKLEPLREEICKMVTNDHLIGSRILKEVRKRGYDGSQAALMTTSTRYGKRTRWSQAMIINQHPMAEP
jgi:transposase